MPVNVFPILILLLVVWAALAGALFGWRRWSGRLFLAASGVALVAHILCTGVEKNFDEERPFRVVEIGTYRTLEITTSLGDKVQAGSPDIVARVLARSNQTVRVSMVGWYDYGRLAAYRIQSIDGTSP